MKVSERERESEWEAGAFLIGSSRVDISERVGESVSRPQGKKVDLSDMNSKMRERGD